MFRLPRAEETWGKTTHGAYRTPTIRGDYLGRWPTPTP